MNEINDDGWFIYNCHQVTDLRKLAMYWAAKEMAQLIICQGDEFIRPDGSWIYGKDYIHRRFLVQLLKKEWFR